MTLFTCLVSCAKVNISDSEVCGDAGPIGGVCFRMLSDTERDVPKVDWDKERVGMLCTKSNNFAEWKGAILKLCKETKLCSYEVKAKIEAVSQKVARVTSPRRQK